MAFLDFMKTETGRRIISFIIGLGLASMFRKVCVDDSCRIYEGPPVKDIENKIFKMESKCYRYKAEAAKCPA
jgi:hypothetical protein